MLGWLMVSLAAVGIFLLVVGSVVTEIPLIVAGGMLTGYALGFTQCRLALLGILRERDEIRR